MASAVNKKWDLMIKVRRNIGDGSKTDYLYLQGSDTVKTLVEEIQKQIQIPDPKPIGSEVATGKKIHIYKLATGTKLSALRIDFSKNLCLLGISPGPKSFCWGACLCGGDEILDD